MSQVPRRTQVILMGDMNAKLAAGNGVNVGRYGGSTKDSKH